LMKTALHEMTHALGFTSSLYWDYMTPQGGFYVAPAVEFTNSKGAQKWKMTTPRVIAYIGEHYGCNTLDGLELEDFNDNGQAGSHWENRLVDSEYMSGVASDDSQLSFITLSFFEDMGWYQSNYSMAEPYNFARNTGCGWSVDPCSATNWGRYWCQDSTSTACNGPRTAGGYCGIGTYTTSLPSYYQYFSDPTQGGTSVWDDYCPNYQGYSNRYCHDPSQSPGSPNTLGEAFGPNSNCWDMTGGSQTDGCFVTECFQDTSNNNTITLRVNIGGNWVVCPLDGGSVQISSSSFFGQNFNIICPEIGFFCSTIGSSGSNFTFDGSNNIPPANASSTPAFHIPPSWPDLPVPPSFLPTLGKLANFFNNPWGLVVGSNLFYILIVIGIVLLALLIACCVCKR